MFNAIEIKNKLYSRYRRIFTKFYLKNFFGCIGRNTIVYKQFRLINPDGVFLGNNVVLLGNSRIELVKEYMAGRYKPKLILGNDSQIHQNCHITCANSIEIGNNVIVVSNVTITDIIHPYDDPYTPINRTELITIPVKIGDQSYIYNNSVILPGTIIGKHCIIGANSVVRGNIPDYSIAVGNPAKVVKQYNFETKSWQRI